MPKQKTLILLFVLCLMAGFAWSQSNALDVYCNWEGLQRDAEGNIIPPKYSNLVAGTRIISPTNGGTTYNVSCDRKMIVLSKGAYEELYFETLRSDSLEKEIKKYIQLSEEVNALQDSIKFQQQQIIYLQDSAITMYREISDSSFGLVKASMANTDQAVRTINKAQLQTALFTVGGVVVGASVGILAGLLLK